jgi:glycosyltransferase involved in cell wall biosynthesis
MTTASTPYVSVIIATRNRAEALRTISLPSLGRQTTRDFEVIVWDASEDDASRAVVEAFSLLHPDLAVRYYRAPRAGLCSQRNDAVKEARGEVIFFIDDDCEVSPDGVAALADMFAKSKEVTGGGLPLCYGEWPRTDGARQIGRAVSRVLRFYARLFYASPRLSGQFPAVASIKAGLVDWLVGCDMAFRREVFRNHRFDERLQKYGGYALWEDALFSHRLLREGCCLRVAERGLVVHWPVPENRLKGYVNKARVTGYNAGILWRHAVFPFNPWSIFFFAWARIGFLGIVLFPCLATPWKKERWQRVGAYLEGLWDFVKDEFLTKGPEGVTRLGRSST